MTVDPIQTRRAELRAKIRRAEAAIRPAQHRLAVSDPGQPTGDALRDIARIYHRLSGYYRALAALENLERSSL